MRQANKNHTKEYSIILSNISLIIKGKIMKNINSVNEMDRIKKANFYCSVRDTKFFKDEIVHIFGGKAFIGFTQSYKPFLISNLNICKNIFIFQIFKYIMIFCISVMLIGCSNESDEKDKSTNNNESYEMLYAKDKTAMQIILQHTSNNTGLLIQKAQDKQSLLRDNAIKVIAFFPNECNMCMPTLIHLSNLLSRNKFLQVFVISEQALHTSGYKDFPMVLNSQIINLVDVNKKSDLLLDSMKKALNMEIRDYKAPIFFIQDTHNVILQSIEGAVLEEIFEQTISQLLSQDNYKDSKQNTQTNTLSKTTSNSTQPLKAGKGE